MPWTILPKSNPLPDESLGRDERGQSAPSSSRGGIVRNIPSNTDNVIDSRDIIERIEELESEREDLESSLSDAVDDYRTAEETKDESAMSTALAVRDSAEEVLCDWDNENADELKVLKALADEGGSETSEWSDGTSLIRDSYFEDYAQELLLDIGDLPRDLPWYIAIDWSETARNLQQDYTVLTFDDVVYWIRNI